MNAQTSLRELTAAEIQLVAGGNNSDIVVVGSRDYWDYDPFAFFDYYFGEDWENSDPYEIGSGGGSEPQPTPEQEAIDKTKDIMQAKIGALQDLQQRYGPNLQIQVGDKYVPVSELLQEMGRLFDLVDAGLTVAQLLNGEIDLHDATMFAFGMTAGAIAASASGSALVGVVVGLAVENSAEYIMDWMEMMGQLNAQLADYFNEQVAQFVENNSDIPPGTYDNPIDMIRGMMGWQVYGDWRSVDIP